MIATRASLVEGLNIAAHKLRQSMLLTVAVAHRRLYRVAVDSTRLRGMIGRRTQRVDELDYRMRDGIRTSLLQRTRALDVAAARLARENPMHNEMSDAVFMVCPLLAKAGKFSGDGAWFDAALRHFEVMRKLCLRGDVLYRHSPLDEAAWGRGNAFPLLGLALTLTDLPAGHAAYGPFLEAYRAHAARLVQVHDNMRTGNLSGRLDLHRSDEFGTLEEGFNRMAEALRGRVEALEEYVGQVLRVPVGREADDLPLVPAGLEPEAAGDVLVEDALVAEALVVELQALQLDAQLRRLVAQDDPREIRVPGLRADGRVLLVHVLDDERRVRGGGEALEERGVRHGREA